MDALQMPPPDEFKVPIPIATEPLSGEIRSSETFKNPLPKTTSTDGQQRPPQPKCTYKEPTWSTVPPVDKNYSIEVLKSGTIVENVKPLESRPFWLFGKLPDNHVVMAHPTISRYHAVLQYRPDIDNTTNGDNSDSDDEDGETEKKDTKLKIEKGWYVYDLQSTHGTFLNKMRIPPKTYVRVRVGHMLKFGTSTRMYILQGPDDDQEAVSELTITEMKEKKKQAEQEQINLKILEEKKREDEGISWGMREDADAETDLSVNPYATTNNEDMFLQDPKKTLRGFFEREGLNLEYKVDEMSAGTFVCRVELPIDDANGRQIVAEVCHKGKKKEVVLQTALEACRILDRHGVLRQANHESRQRKPQQSDSDEDDDYLDRTGDVQRRRIKKAAATAQNVALSYEELLQEEQELNERIKAIDIQIAKYQALDKKSKQEAEAEVDLDAFMNNLSKEKVVDKTEIRRLRVEQQRLRNDKLKLLKLIKIARPIELPPLQNQSADGSVTSDTRKKGLRRIYGKRLTAAKLEAKPKYSEALASNQSEDEEEIEEHEEHEDSKDSEIDVSTEINQDEPPQNIELLASGATTTNNKMSKESPQSTNNKTPMKTEIVSQTDEENSSFENVADKSSSLKREHEKEPIDVSTSSIPLAKKKRSRVRIRGERRENVDMDDKDELQDADKYSKWVPPENQQGDGYTSLNDKYGY